MTGLWADGIGGKYLPGPRGNLLLGYVKRGAGNLANVLNSGYMCRVGRTKGVGGGYGTIPCLSVPCLRRDGRLPCRPLARAVILNGRLPGSPKKKKGANIYHMVGIMYEYLNEL